LRIVVDANTVLSGLFFGGNERKLLLEFLRGNVGLIFAEDVVDEIYRVIERRFPDHRLLRPAMAMLRDILSLGELVPRKRYVQEAVRWRGSMRDPSDAPVIACAIAANTDGIVTGDLELELATRTPRYRTKALLSVLGAKRGIGDERRE
jgi:putative PIN family toxin of toxin-antitoxin system